MSWVSSILSQEISWSPFVGVSRKLIPGNDFITPLNVDGVAVLLLVCPRLAWGDVTSDTSSVDESCVLISSIGWEGSGSPLYCAFLALSLLFKLPLLDFLVLLLDN